MNRIQPEDYPSRSELAYDEHGPYPDPDEELEEKTDHDPISRGVLLAAAENESNAYRNWVHARAFGTALQIAARGKDLARARHRFIQAKANHTRETHGSSSKNSIQITPEVLERTHRRALDLIRRATKETYSDDVAAEASAVAALLTIAHKRAENPDDRDVIAGLLAPRGHFFGGFMREWERSGTIPIHRSEYYLTGVDAGFAPLLREEGADE